MYSIVSYLVMLGNAGVVAPCGGLRGGAGRGSAGLLECALLLRRVPLALAAREPAAGAARLLRRAPVRARRHWRRRLAPHQLDRRGRQHRLLHVQRLTDHLLKRSLALHGLALTRSNHDPLSIRAHISSEIMILSLHSLVALTRHSYYSFDCSQFVISNDSPLTRAEFYVLLFNIKPFFY